MDLRPKWLAAARTGCRDALGRAFQSWRRYLLSIAREELPADLQAKGGASDLVQETFLEASLTFEDFRGETEGEFRAWLRQLLRHRLAKLGRRYRTTHKRRLDLEQTAGTLGRTEEVSAALPTPSAQVMEQEQTQALRIVLERLPDDYRRVIRLRYEEECSFEEIRRLMGRTANAARLLWLRAIERVKQELGAVHGL